MRARHIWVELVCSLLSAETFVSKYTVFCPLRENQHSICSALIRIGVLLILKFSLVIYDLLGNLKFETLQFEQLLTADKMKILLNEPLTSNDCTFLRSLYVAAFPGQDSLDFTKVKKAKIHGCRFILKLFYGENGSVKCIVLD